MRCRLAYSSWSGTILLQTSSRTPWHWLPLPSFMTCLPSSLPVWKVRASDIPADKCGAALDLSDRHSCCAHSLYCVVQGRLKFSLDTVAFEGSQLLLRARNFTRQRTSQACSHVECTANLSCAVLNEHVGRNEVACTQCRSWCLMASAHALGPTPALLQVDPMGLCCLRSVRCSLMHP